MPTMKWHKMVRTCLDDQVDLDNDDLNDNDNDDVNNDNFNFVNADIAP